MSCLLSKVHRVNGKRSLISMGKGKFKDDYGEYMFVYWKRLKADVKRIKAEV